MEVRETNSLNELRKLLFKVDTGLKPNTRKGIVLSIAFTIMVSPALAIDFNSSKALQYYGDGSTLDFEVGTNGQVLVPNGGVDLSSGTGDIVVSNNQGLQSGSGSRVEVGGGSNNNVLLLDKDGVQALEVEDGGLVDIKNQLNVGSTECPVGSYIDGDGSCTSVTGETSGEYVDETGDTMTGPLNITDIANFTSSGIEFYQPLSVDSPGSLAVDSGVDLTGSGSNTIDSYSTLYLKTSSGSPSDIVLRPSGQVGIDSNLETTGNLTVNGQEIDVTGATLKNVNLEADSVDESEINQNTLDDSEIQDNSLSSSSLAANSVTNSELDNSVNLDVSTPSNTGGALDVGGQIKVDGGLDTYNNIDLNENELQNIDRLEDNTGTATIDFDGSNNVAVPNGNFDVGSPSNTGKTLDVGGGANFNGNINLNNGGGLDNVDDIEMDGNIYGAGVDMSLQEVGSVLGPDNGDTDLNIQTQGSGSHVVSIEDGSSSNIDIARFNEGTQNVEIPNGQLNMNSNKIVSVSDPTNGQDAATKSYVDSEVSSGTTTATQTLSEVLSEDNSAGSYNIDMNGQQINNANKVGVATSNPSENLDVDGTASVSNSGTTMKVDSNGNVVVTLG